MTDEILVVGLSHKTAPLALREKLAVEGTALGALLREVRASVYLDSVIVSTCNRVELYGTARDPGAATNRARELFQRRAEMPLEDALYVYRGREAVRHAFRVASSLDSMVVGEPQILGQVKTALDTATEAGVGTLLGRCFQRALAVAKRVRTETSIAEGTVSVSSIACALARKIFGELEGRQVVLLGAGEMGEAAAKALAGTGARLRVVNRSIEKAQRLAADCNGKAVSIEQLASELVATDVVITSTSSPKYVLDAKLMKDVVRTRRRRPLFLIDIAVPRDVDPRVGQMPNVFLYDVDDLQRVADENIAHRQKAATAAERIVDIELAEFEAWRRSLDLTPTIVGLRERFGEVVRAELERARGKLGDLTPAQQAVLDKTANALVNKLLHTPLSSLKQGDPALIAAVRTLFDLDAAEEEQRAPEAVKRELATEKS